MMIVAALACQHARVKASRARFSFFAMPEDGVDCLCLPEWTRRFWFIIYVLCVFGWGWGRFRSPLAYWCVQFHRIGQG